MYITPLMCALAKSLSKAESRIHKIKAMLHNFARFLNQTECKCNTYD